MAAIGAAGGALFQPRTGDADGLALDPSRLGDLKAAATRDDPVALKKVAQEFEALLLQEVLKSMRQASPGDELTDSQATKTFTGMLDQQYAQSIAHAKGMGLADMIVNQVRAAIDSGVKKPAAAADKG